MSGSDDAARRHLADEVAYAGAIGDDDALVTLTEQDVRAERGDAGLAARKSRSLLRASALPAVGTSLSRASGLLRVAALTAALGLSELADVYNLANTTPNILYELVLGGVLSSTLVPLFVRSLDDPDDDSASVITTVSFVAIVALTVTLTLLAPAINALFAIPLSGSQRAEQLSVGGDLMALLIPQVLFYGLTTLFTALLHARRRFAPPAFTPVLTNVITAAAALISVYWVSSNRSTAQIYVLGLGTTIGVAAMAFALIPYLRRSDINLQWRFRPRHPAVKSLLRVSGWVVGFAATNQIAYLIILGLALTLQPGALSAFNYAFIFFQLPHGLIAVSLMTASLPELAEAAADGAEQRFRAKFREGASLLLTFLIPATVGVWFLAVPLIKLFLQRGNFTAEDTTVTADMLQAFVIGLPAFSVYLFVVRAFYARKDTRTPFFLNLVQNVVNVVIMFPITAAFGAAGLALAYSLSYWLIVVVALVVLQRKVGGVLDRATFGALGRSLAVGACVAVALTVVYAFIWPVTPDRALFNVIVGLAVALGVFIPATFVFRPQGFEPAVDRLRRGWRGRGRSMAG